MTRLLTLSCLLLCLSLASGCQKQSEQSETAPKQPTEQKAAALPDADGRTLMEFITVTQDYKQWPMFPGKEALYKGQHPHGAYLTTYVSPPVREALQSKTGQLPDGSIIVKENYTPEKELAAVTVMYRRTGYNPEAGDWYWLKYGPDKALLAEGRVDDCINCHRSVQNNDWVFTGPVK
jgi:hypothetical protein